MTGDQLHRHSDGRSDEIDRFLSCVSCGWAFSIETTCDDERCTECDGELAVRVMPEEAR